MFKLLYFHYKILFKNRILAVKNIHIYLSAGNKPKYKHKSSFMTLGKVVCQNIILTEDTLTNFLPCSFNDLHHDLHQWMGFAQLSWRWLISDDSISMTTQCVNFTCWWMWDAVKKLHRNLKSESWVRMSLEKVFLYWKYRSQDKYILYALL